VRKGFFIRFRKYLIGRAKGLSGKNSGLREAGALAKILTGEGDVLHSIQKLLDGKSEKGGPANSSPKGGVVGKDF
jgi:hypothetical protein